MEQKILNIVPGKKPHRVSRVKMTHYHQHAHPMLVVDECAIRII